MSPFYRRLLLALLMRSTQIGVLINSDFFLVPSSTLGCLRTCKDSHASESRVDLFDLDSEASHFLSTPTYAIATFSSSRGSNSSGFGVERRRHLKKKKSSSSLSERHHNSYSVYRLAWTIFTFNSDNYPLTLALR